MAIKSKKNFGGLIAVLIFIAMITWTWALPLPSIDHEHVGLRNKTTGNIDVWKCPECEPGMGLSVQCGEIFDSETVIECVPCKEGETFSDTRDIGQCKPCRICPAFEKKTGKCSVDQDTTQCFCKAGFYMDETRACAPCSWCCDDHKSNHVISECKGNPQGKHCSFQDRKDCAPTHPTNATDQTTSVPKKDFTTKHEVLPSEKEKKKKDIPEYMDKERSNDTEKIVSVYIGLPTPSIALIIAIPSCVILVASILFSIAYGRGRHIRADQAVYYNGDENVNFLPHNSAETGAVRLSENTQPTANEKKLLICQKFGPKIEHFMCHDAKHEVCLMLNPKRPQTNDDYESVAYKAGMKFYQVKNLSETYPMEDVLEAMIGEARTLEYFVDILNKIGRTDVVNKMYDMALS